ncbi:MAG: MBL fold metallo-hydrolase [Marinilabiliaceae bacterium]|nr:MBL fold metallo-hydrolase [Marinilabiliaceae bacterium]
MKIVELIENNLKSPLLLSEHGLAVYVEVDNERWLLDTGQSNKILHNAEVLEIDLSAINLNGIVISHGHYDHAGGAGYIVDALKRDGREVPAIYAHSGARRPKWSVSERMVKSNGWARAAELGDMGYIRWLPSGVHRISRKLTLFTLPGDAPVNPHLSLSTDESGAIDGLIPDNFEDELFALLTSENGETLLYGGCTHHGLAQLLQYAFNVLGCGHIDKFVGGLHLMGRSEKEIAKAIATVRGYDVREWIVNHCTGPVAEEMWKKLR